MSEFVEPTYHLDVLDVEVDLNDIRYVEYLSPNETYPPVLHDRVVARQLRDDGGELVVESVPERGVELFPASITWTGTRFRIVYVPGDPQDVKLGVVDE
jgi:hypothetical protein